MEFRNIILILVILQQIVSDFSHCTLYTLILNNQYFFKVGNGQQSNTRYFIVRKSVDFASIGALLLELKEDIDFRKRSLVSKIAMNYNPVSVTNLLIIFSQFKQTIIKYFSK